MILAGKKDLGLKSTHHSVDIHLEGLSPLFNEFSRHLILLDHILLR